MKYSEDEIRRTIFKAIKYINRYGNVSMDIDALLQILFFAAHGIDCKISHINICEKRSLLKYFGDEEIDDPYLKQLIEKIRRELNEK